MFDILEVVGRMSGPMSGCGSCGAVCDGRNRQLRPRFRLLTRQELEVKGTLQAAGGLDLKAYWTAR